MQIADRLSKIPPYLFMELRKKINKAKADGIDVISLAIGDPVEATPTRVVEELAKEAKKAENHRYPTDEEKGMLAFRTEVARWYKRRYGVTVDPQGEVLGLIGSKEGCHHFVLACINPMDTVLMTDPGYPAYRSSILLGGAEPYNVPILLKNNFLPILSDIPTEIAKKATGIFLNYPNNPTGACATKEFFADLVRFAKDFDITVCCDNPYSEIVFADQERLSFLSAEGAKDVGVELNSLSKPFNMTGWRIGMALGNADIIAAMSKVKENTDSGVFNPIQLAAIHALQHEEGTTKEMLSIYQRRRELVLATLKSIGIDFNPPQGTFYLWVPTPNGVSAIDFTNRLFDKTAVVVAAGTAYGQYGEGYIRISLTVSDDRLTEAMQRIKKEFA
ncbi:MAG: LL-diaminopimelate aminotransferase [Deltaproteobacteria bacterium]|nr:LL-diaminopimelate aminotransferase [Deltaproteobacteria bacterium]